MIEKAILILSEYNIEPTNDILVSMNKLERESSSKDEFLTSIMRIIAQIVMSQVQKTPVDERNPQRVSSQLASHFQTRKSEDDGSLL